MTHEEVLEKIKENSGEWKPSQEISFTVKENDENHIIIKFADGYELQDFGHGDVEDYVYIAHSRGPVKDAVYLLKYCSYIGLDTSEIKNLTPRVEMVEKEDVVGRAKLAVYQDIFRNASKITIDQK